MLKVPSLPNVSSSTFCTAQVPMLQISAGTHGPNFATTLSTCACPLGPRDEQSAGHHSPLSRRKTCPTSALRPLVSLSSSSSFLHSSYDICQGPRHSQVHVQVLTAAYTYRRQPFHATLHPATRRGVHCEHCEPMPFPSAPTLPVPPLTNEGVLPHPR
jgi:hypothetical protein